ncbi:sodium/nucleoside cotransporter 1-like [Clavelina lepadiformis]|uniref:sodium/nucleoside cotransporter 1-like n=1 Tax=Clavelina lepadiformis TaxID=159417 RepID=UPI004043663C
MSNLLSYRSSPSEEGGSPHVVEFTAAADLPQNVEKMFYKENETEAAPPQDEDPPAYNGVQSREPFQNEILNEEEEEALNSLSCNPMEDRDSPTVKSTQNTLQPKTGKHYEKERYECDSEKTDKKEKWNICLRLVTYPVMAMTQFFTNNKTVALKVTGILFAIGITVYMVVACCKNFIRALPLLVIWLLVVAYKIYIYVKKRFGEAIWNVFRPTYRCCITKMNWIKWFFIACIVVGFIVWIVLDTSKRPRQFIPCMGYFVFIFVLFVTSKYPSKVVWRPVLWGLLIQTCLGMIVLRTAAGFAALNWLGNLVQVFINFVDAGVIFVFGKNFAEHYFAFKVLPLVLYFSSFISIMYYLGAMQWIILKLAWLMQISLNTSATESMVAAGNIFVGQTESPLLIRPYLEDLTTSELHAVMTAGFGTIAGSVLGAYIGFGIQPVYVIAACFMAAPCALAISKLVYPETKQSKFLKHEGLVLEKTKQRNIIEAAFVGASQAIPLVLNIGGNLIAFLSLLAAVNGFLNWFGGLVDYPQLSFEVICSYIFMPVSFLMGVEWQDCFKAAELIGTKIFLNEFIAYQSLAEMIKLRDSGIAPKLQPDTGVVNWVDEHTEAIVTYALCGFANFGSIGIMLGGLGSIVESRQSEMTKIVLRALVAGVFVSILNACIAGFLYVPRPIVCDHMLATTNWTYTEPGRLFQCCSSALYSNETVFENCCNSFNWTNTGYMLNCSALSG